MTDVQMLVTELAAVRQKLKDFKEKEAAITAEIKELCEPGEVLTNMDGEPRYQIVAHEQYVYSLEAIQCLPKNVRDGLVKLSKTTLDALLKRGAINKLAYGKIQKNSTTRQIISIKDVGELKEIE